MSRFERHPVYSAGAGVSTTRSIVFYSPMLFRSLYKLNIFVSSILALAVDQQTNRRRTSSNRGYSHIDIPNVTWKIDKRKIQRKLCQNCIDQINSACIWGKPAEYAVVSFKEKQIRPIVDSNPWFVFGIYSVDVALKDQDINLKIEMP